VCEVVLLRMTNFSRANPDARMARDMETDSLPRDSTPCRSLAAVADGAVLPDVHAPGRS
jgi:hypothetical protein